MMVNDTVSFFLSLSAGFLLNFWVWKKHFYSLSSFSWCNLPGTFLVAVFSFYLFIAYFGAPLIFRMVLELFPPSRNLATAAELFVLFIMLAVLLLFTLHPRRKSITLKLLKYSDKDFSTLSTSLMHDIKMGLLTFIISYPVVAVVEQIGAWSIFRIFGIEDYEQMAVTYFRQSLGSLFSLLSALFTIVLYAPCLEEFLFRGCLQTYLKNRWGFAVALPLSSLIFAFFHFSASLGWGNLPILLSLFVLASFLGFIYEKQKSLYASITLHASFNLLGVLQILYMHGSNGA